MIAFNVEKIQQFHNRRLIDNTCIFQASGPSQGGDQRQRYLDFLVFPSGAFLVFKIHSFQNEPLSSPEDSSSEEDEN